MTLLMTEAIEAAGFGLSGDIGGLKRITYYTPDGRIVRAIPQIRDYVIKRGHEVIESGTRDANLDKGWLLQMPPVKKLFCPTCDRWHDTKAEVQACKIAQDKMIKQMSARGRKEIAKDNSDKDVKIDELTRKVEELTKLIGGILNAKPT